MLLVSCTNSETHSPDSKHKQDTAGNPIAAKKLGLYTLEGDSVVVPPFEIEVLLSPNAKERIVSGNETIIVAAFLQGTPKDPSKAQLAEDGSFFVGSAEREISYGQIAGFDKLKFSKKIYDQLADKDVDLTVNIYTGRRSSPNNLITGDFLSDKVSHIINKRFTLNYKLIDGDD